MSSNRGRHPGSVPDRWLHCPRKATHLIVEKFLACKTPLGEQFDDQVPAEFRFHPRMIFQSLKPKKIKLGLWIDLTNTSRFYNKDFVESQECKYVKLECKGHSETPTLDQIKIFISLVSRFIANKPLEIILVHCTHGFNRTGFLIVSYLVRQMDFSLDTALDEFAYARAPGIYKGDYIEALYNMYDNVANTPLPPERPSWCFENNDHSIPPPEELSDEAEEDEPESSTSTEPKKAVVKKRRNGKTVPFMEGVNGVTEFTDQPKALRLQQMVQRMCGWKLKDFPGCQPVSMDQNNLKFLSNKPYRVSWKADGMRYMMLINGENEVYFFDRNHTVFHVEGLRFPMRRDLHAHLNKTLIDGEMVIDKVMSNGVESSIPRYLAYDIVIFNGDDVGRTPFFPTRLHCLEHEVIKPRYSAMEAGIIDKAREPFSIRHKQFWHITQSKALLGEKFASSLAHEPDGLIFQPSMDPYKAGRCDEVLKWKPASMNSVDFKLKITKEGGMGVIPKKVCQLYVGQDVLFGKIKWSKVLDGLHGKIIECKFENNEWKFMRQRTDKTYPNSLNTAQAVCGSILVPVTEEILLNFIDKEGYKDDLMGPPAKRIRR